MGYAGQRRPVRGCATSGGTPRPPVGQTPGGRTIPADPKVLFCEPDYNSRRKTCNTATSQDPKITSGCILHAESPKWRFRLIAQTKRNPGPITFACPALSLVSRSV